MNRVLLLLWMMLTGTGVVSAQLSDSLFQHPSSNFYPAVRWVWPDDSISKEGINLDLETLSSAGFSNIWLQLENGRNRQSPVKTGSKRYEDLLAHALLQAQRLGLTLWTDTSSHTTDKPLHSGNAGDFQNATSFVLQKDLTSQRLQVLSLIKSSHPPLLYLNAIRHRPEAFWQATDSCSMDRYQPQLQKIGVLLPCMARMSYLFSQIQCASSVACLGSSPVDAEGMIHEDWTVIHETDLLRSSVRLNRLVLQDGREFRTLFLQSGSSLHLGTLKHLRDLLSDGLQLVAEQPEAISPLTVPEKKQWDAVLQDVWGRLPGGVYRYGAGRLYYKVACSEWLGAVSNDLCATLKDGRATDLRMESYSAGSLNAWWVSGTSDDADTILACFPVTGQKPEVWNPTTGRVEKNLFYNSLDGRIFLLLTLQPHQPVLVVFRSDKDTDAGKTLWHNGVKCWTADPDWFDHLLQSGAKTDSLPDVMVAGSVNWVRGKGEYLLTAAAHFSEKRIRLKTDLPYRKLIRGWTCRDMDDSGVPPVVVDSLNGDRGPVAEHREWRNTFFLTRQELDGLHWILKTGRYAGGVEIVVNGQSAGFLWCEPFQMDVTTLLKPGLNSLLIQEKTFSGKSTTPVSLTAWKKI